MLNFVHLSFLFSLSISSFHFLLFHVFLTMAYYIPVFSQFLLFLSFSKSSFVLNLFSLHSYSYVFLSFFLSFFKNRQIIEGVRAKNLEATLVCRFFQVNWFHTQRKDGANTSSLWSLQRNCYRHNDALQKHESQGSLTGWRHILLRHCCWSSARRYTHNISVYNLTTYFELR